MGIHISGLEKNDSCFVEYKKAQDSEWLGAFTLDKMILSGTIQWRGSLFLLDQATAYDVRISIVNGSAVKILPIQKQSTLSLPNFAPTSHALWVSPNGTGDFTKSNPGNLNALFSSGRIRCGTSIMLTDGIYNEQNLQLTLSADCTEQMPIVMLAAPGAKPIVDAGVAVTAMWTPHPSDGKLFSAALPARARHSAICILDNVALYPYPAVTANFLLGNYNLAELNFGYDGFVRDENTVWIKTARGTNPNHAQVIVSAANRFLTVYGNNKNAFLKIKGIEFRHFGKPVLNSLGSAIDAYSAAVFDFRNAHHVYFDSCRFLFNTISIAFNNLCNNLSIQNCYFKHDVGKWSSAMIKKSHDYVHTFLGTISSSRGRAVEFPAVFLHEGKSIVVRGNFFDGLNSGIESYIEEGLKEEVDLYENIFIDNFDAVECDGQWSNLRVWGNQIINPMAGISAAPPLIGPRYFYRNIIHGMKGRRNEEHDPYFIGCRPIQQDFKAQGVGVKTNPKYTGPLPTGNLYFFNNTFHALDSLGFVFTSWEAEWKKAVFINNSYSHAVSHPFFYFNLADKPANGNFQLSSIHENYFTFNELSPIAVVKHKYGEFQCTEIFTVSELQSTLRDISGSSLIDIQHPRQLNPGFVRIEVGNFALDPQSPLIDAGIPIPGFYDYFGERPDIGAQEYRGIPSNHSSTKRRHAILLHPNPCSNYLFIHAPTEADQIGLEIFNAMGIKMLALPKLDNPSQLNVDLLPDGLYFAVVSSMRSAKNSAVFIKISR